jgi:hypothetical protein
LILATALSLFATAQLAPGPAAAEPAAPKPEQVFVRVDHLTISAEALKGELREQFLRSGLATGKSMDGIRVTLAAAMTSGKVSVLDSFSLTMSPGAPVRFDPMRQKGRLGLTVTLAPELEAGQINANIQLAYEQGTRRVTILTPSGTPAALSLSPVAGDADGKVRLVLLTLTRLPVVSPM